MVTQVGLVGSGVGDTRSVMEATMHGGIEVSEEAGSLGARGAGGRALPLVDDGQRRLLLPGVVQCLQHRLELRIPCFVRRYALHLHRGKMKL